MIIYNRILLYIYCTIIIIGITGLSGAVLGIVASKHGWTDRLLAISRPADPPIPQSPVWARELGDSHFEKMHLEVGGPHIDDIGVVKINSDKCLDIFTVNHAFPFDIALNTGDNGFERAPIEDLHDALNVRPTIRRRPPNWNESDVALHGYGRAISIQASPYLAAPVTLIFSRPTSTDLLEAARESSRWILQPMFMRNADSEVLENGPERIRVRVRLFADGRAALATNMISGMWTLSIVEGTEIGRIDPGPFYRRDGNVIRQPVNPDIHGLAAADFDSDGTTSLLFISGGMRGLAEEIGIYRPDPLVSWLNGQAIVRDPAEVGIEKRHCPARQVQVTDANADGLSDISITCGRWDASEPYPNQLWIRGAEGRFRDRADELGLAYPDMDRLRWVDLDNDGRLDVLSSRANEIVVLKNTPDGFVEEASFEAIGLATTPPTVADFDADGDFDVALPGHVKLLINDGGVLTPSTPTGLKNRKARALSWVDYNNDGLNDLHLVPGGIFRQKEDGDFEPTGLATFGSEPMPISALSNWFDMDGDGGMDLLAAATVQGAGAEWRENWELELYQNVGDRGSWMILDLQGVPGNLNAVGTRVRVTAGGRTRIAAPGLQEGSAHSHGNFEMHVGLGAVNLIERVEIEWPDGSTTVATDLPANQRYVGDWGTSVIRPDALVCSLENLFSDIVSSNFMASYKGTHNKWANH